MQLNYEFIQAESSLAQGTLVLIHGLFGSLSNLGVLARAFQTDYDIVQIDLRNHGLSEHSDEMNYSVMAHDVIDTLDQLKIEQFSVIGHSMGGKVAMKLSEIAPSRLAKLIVLDMAPVAYQQRHHDAIFKALNAVSDAQVQTRKQATEIMQSEIHENGVIQFLLKSFNQGQWRFNVEVLYRHYTEITGWNEIKPWTKPSLFIRGENSKYIAQPEYVDAIYQQFPHAKIETVSNTGHWLHAEQPEQVIAHIRTYLQQIESEV